jgi:predicted nuclease with TOPRIM domain
MPAGEATERRAGLEGIREDMGRIKGEIERSREDRTNLNTDIRAMRNDIKHLSDELMELSVKLDKLFEGLALLQNASMENRERIQEHIENHRKLLWAGMGKIWALVALLGTLIISSLVNRYLMPRIFPSPQTTITAEVEELIKDHRELMKMEREEK